MAYALNIRLLSLRCEFLAVILALLNPYAEYDNSSFIKQRIALGVKLSHSQFILLLLSLDSLYLKAYECEVSLAYKLS